MGTSGAVEPPTERPPRVVKLVTCTAYEYFVMDLCLPSKPVFRKRKIPGWLPGCRVTKGFLSHTHTLSLVALSRLSDRKRLLLPIHSARPSPEKSALSGRTPCMSI